MKTGTIQQAIRDSIETGAFYKAGSSILDGYLLKLAPHELLFDGGRVGKRLTPESTRSLDGIRNRIVNVIRFGEELKEKYVKSLICPFAQNKRDFLACA